MSLAMCICKYGFNESSLYLYKIIYIYIYARPKPQYPQLQLIYHIYQSQHIGLLHNSSKTKLCKKITAKFWNTKKIVFL